MLHIQVPQICSHVRKLDVSPINSCQCATKEIHFKCNKKQEVNLVCQMPFLTQPLAVVVEDTEGASFIPGATGQRSLLVFTLITTSESL